MVSSASSSSQAVAHGAKHSLAPSQSSPAKKRRIGAPEEPPVTLTPGELASRRKDSATQLSYLKNFQIQEISTRIFSFILPEQYPGTILTTFSSKPLARLCGVSRSAEQAVLTYVQMILKKFSSHTFHWCSEVTKEDDRYSQLALEREAGFPSPPIPLSHISLTAPIQAVLRLSCEAFINSGKERGQVVQKGKNSSASSASASVGSPTSDLQQKRFARVGDLPLIPNFQVTNKWHKLFETQYMEFSKRISLKASNMSNLVLNFPHMVVLSMEREYSIHGRANTQQFMQQVYTNIIEIWDSLFKSKESVSALKALISDPQFFRFLEWSVTCLVSGRRDVPFMSKAFIDLDFVKWMWNHKNKKIKKLVFNAYYKVRILEWLVRDRNTKRLEWFEWMSSEPELRHLLSQPLDCRRVPFSTPPRKSDWFLIDEAFCWYQTDVLDWIYNHKDPAISDQLNRQNNLSIGHHELNLEHLFEVLNWIADRPKMQPSLMIDYSFTHHRRGKVSFSILQVMMLTVKSFPVGVSLFLEALYRKEYFRSWLYAHTPLWNTEALKVPSTADNGAARYLETFHWLSRHSDPKIRAHLLPKGGDEIGNFPAFSFLQFPDLSGKVPELFEQMSRDPFLKQLLSDSLSREGANIAHIAALHGRTTALDWIYTQEEFRGFIWSKTKKGDSLVQYCAQSVQSFVWPLLERDGVLLPVLHPDVLKVYNALSSIICWVTQHPDPRVRALHKGPASTLGSSQAANSSASTSSSASSAASK